VPQATAPPRPRVVLRQGQDLPKVGLHQCPSERKGEGGPVRGLHVPSHVPSHPQNAAKLQGFSRTASAFTAETDCLLEEAGFEPLVPLNDRGQNGRIASAVYGLALSRDLHSKSCTFTGI
jgi:hypothetical protein